MAPLAMSEILLPRRRRTIGFRPIRKTGPTLRINQNDPPNGLGQLAALASPAMSSDDADRYRKQAEECRQQAQKAVSPLDKEAWLRVAEEWLMLAACPNSRCSILSESDSTLGDEQVFSPLEYRSDAASAAECAGLRAERPCLAIYR